MSQEEDSDPGQSDFVRFCACCPDGCCCGVKPPLTSRRMRIIVDYLNVNGLSIDKPFEKTEYTFPREIDGSCCIFWNKDARKCKIHPVKPETCVAGPVTFDINEKTGKIEWRLKMERVCPLAGSLYRDKGALRNHLESARKELIRLVDELEDEALQAIMRIEEPDTFKIGEEEIDAEVVRKLKPSV